VRRQHCLKAATRAAGTQVVATELYLQDLFVAYWCARTVGSARVMEKAGLRYEGVLRGYLHKGDHFEDVAMYALLRPEFTS